MGAISKALREQVWLQRFGKVFEHKCTVKWCINMINVYNFHCGHNIPASKGGKETLQNLYPICANCNLGMGDKYTIKEWSVLHNKIIERQVVYLSEVHAIV